MKDPNAANKAKANKLRREKSAEVEPDDMRFATCPACSKPIYVGDRYVITLDEVYLHQHCTDEASPKGIT